MRFMIAFPPQLPEIHSKAFKTCNYSEKTHSGSVEQLSMKTKLSTSVIHIYRVSSVISLLVFTNNPVRLVPLCLK